MSKPLKLQSAYTSTPTSRRYPNPTTSHVDSWYWNELLMSEGHYRLKSGKWSGGGPFACAKLNISHHGPLYLPFTAVGSYYEYQMLGVNPSGLGNQYVIPILYSPPTLPSWTELRAEAARHYATGYARARPGRPEASLGQFIAELRDVPAIPFKGVLQKFRRLIQRRGGSLQNLPHVLKAESKNYVNLGSEYLNYTFGWEPFVRDLRQMYYLWQNLDKRLAQLVRENGKAIRRKATVLNESSSESASGRESIPFKYVYGPPPNYFGGVSTVTASATTTERVWFSGNFRYYIPDVGTSAWTKRATRALFGAWITPELVWELTPWSWLIDWFSNVGDVMSNMSANAAENLVCNYSYIMRSWTRRIVLSAFTSWNEVNNSSYKLKRGAHSFYSTYDLTYKTRVGGGNPFGLDVSLPSLSTKQLAILAALGISRGACS